LALQRTSDAHRGRLVRRVVSLFILSALVPLTLCALFLFRAFGAELASNERQALNGLVRSYGMTILGRLNSADDVIKVITMQAATTDAAIQDKVGKLLWVRSARRVRPSLSSNDSEQNLPAPNARQRRALQDGEPCILWGSDEYGNTQVYLVRALPSSAWLYTEITLAWLWADASDYAGGAALVVRDDAGERLLSTGKVPRGYLDVTAVDGQDPASPSADPATGVAKAIPGIWMSQSWELFLASRYASPSWHLIAIAERPTLVTAANGAFLYLCGFILITILLIAWLSMTVIRRQLRPLELLTQATKRIAQRDFAAFKGMNWADEFGDLARSFGAMSDKLQAQFTTLETLAEVDRLLLASPELESILDTLLPRISSLLGCDSVSVLLFDTDSAEHARAYDYYASDPTRRPVRRITRHIPALRITCDRPSLPLIDASSASQLACLAPNAPQTIATVRLQALKHDGECVGVLCVGYPAQTAEPLDNGVSAADFGDRLSLILANLQQSERLRRQANFDSLTGLQNRQRFSDSVRAAVMGAEAAQGIGSLLYIDLDHFKRVNDTAGHAAGDGLLRVVAERLAASIGEGQSIARLGGDEFAVLLPSIAEADAARKMAERVIAGIQAPILIDGREHQVSASIGMCVFPADGINLEELLKAGDIAMYHAKDTGRGHAVFFQKEMQHKLMERLRLESGMHRALLQQDFALHYQPIVSEVAGGMLAVEALVRWPGVDQAAWIPPSVFIPVAEDNGLIVKLGEWVLRSACAQFARWRNTGVRLLYVSVNVSVRQLKEANYLATLLSALADNGMQGSELQVEITESVLAHGAELESTLVEIAAQGVRLALDDFGTGYSSLSYLRAYPIDTVKIDSSFVRGLPHDVAACRLAESIIVMCGALGKKVIAEGVETEAQRQFLRRAGCTTIQGYLLGRPMEAADIPGFARRLHSTVNVSLTDRAAPAPPQLPRSA
jgi:diguanylate cyclase (GGDEF)-like protein